MHGSFIHTIMLDFKYNDGGRHKAHRETGRKEFFGPANDCVTRALAIVSEIEYSVVWGLISSLNVKEGKRLTANSGVRCSSPMFKSFMKGLGYEFVPTTEEVPFNGVNFRTTLTQPLRLKDVELPAGKVFVLITGHAIAVIDGVMQDTHVSTKGNSKCYGYYIEAPKTPIMYNVHSAATGGKLNRAPLNYEQAETMARLMMLNYKKETTIKPNA